MSFIGSEGLLKTGGELIRRDPVVSASGEIIGWKEEVLPTYTCAHCTDVVVMRADRSRERTVCKKCMRYICETKPICRADCTPMHQLAKDHFEGPLAAKYGRHVNAIMAGHTMPISNSF